MGALADTPPGEPVPDGGEILSLRLYIAGDGPNSSEARANLHTILEARPGTQYQLEVVDFLREPHRALMDGVIVTPTLVRLLPLPVQRIIGTLKETRTVVAALGIIERQHG